eukprot:gnl/Ergobibamus_cyprinoides/2051.p1 GENE.gnl/Ergobibamus_cyprinoides/2051~~gnl/Ergobibamus_cyprinoides/2051.p1  ORF type:complete len:289 (+),score=124.54 gnl/Ergobibamus_cyprinoides/2051:45-869(+)
MPVLGLGVYQITDEAQCEQVVVDAVQAGYRLIDTAAIYGNEAAVGRAIKRCGVPRAQLFVVTKIWCGDFGYEATKAAFAASLKRLDCGYVDLVLLHQPYGDIYGAWRALEEIHTTTEQARALGVSNFYEDRLLDFCLRVETKPVVNQVETHPWFQQAAFTKLMEELGVRHMSWAPFAEGHNGLFAQPDLAAVGAKHGKSAAQVVLRWLVQRGVVAIPKSVHKERLQENIAVFDFELDEEDMARVARLEIGERLADHTSLDFVRELARVAVPVDA